MTDSKAALGGAGINRETRPANINRCEVLETGTSEANLVAFMPDDAQDFSDFAHYCV